MLEYCSIWKSSLLEIQLCSMHWVVSVYLFLGLSDDDRDAVGDCILNAMKAWSADDESSSGPRRCEATAGSILDDSDSDNENAGYSTLMLNTYRCSKVKPISSDPLEYWKSKQPVFPNIALQAQKLLCIPVTSVPY